jgi:cytochrome P450
MSQTVRLVGDAVRMNVAAAIRTRRRGYTGWTGAINTDYDPQDPATAAQPFDAYRALHRGGRVHYNPRRATVIVAGLDDVRAALRDTGCGSPRRWRCSPTATSTPACADRCNPDSAGAPWSPGRRSSRSSLSNSSSNCWTTRVAMS